ncbi:MAG: hypothetical protein WBV69_14385, partial [Candidatus Sulfotelmatobacter sp.]
MREHMTPEDELCLLLSRRHLGAIQDRTLELLASPVKWQTFLQRAYSYDVAPLICHNLEILDFPNVPREVLA